jgi:hypothetical protein
MLQEFIWSSYYPCNINPYPTGGGGMLNFRTMFLKKRKYYLNKKDRIIKQAAFLYIKQILFSIR